MRDFKVGDKVIIDSRNEALSHGFKEGAIVEVLKTGEFTIKCKGSQSDLLPKYQEKGPDFLSWWMRKDDSTLIEGGTEGSHSEDTSVLKDPDRGGRRSRMTHPVASMPTTDGRTVNTGLYDYINPEHYKNFSTETIDMMVAIWGKEKVADHCEMCAFKYKMRMGTKPNQPVDRDMKKVEWYLNKAKELRGE